VILPTITSPTCHAFLVHQERHADWTELRVLILLFVDCHDKKNEIFAQSLLHAVKERNKMGVAKKIYAVDVLTM